MFVIKSFITCSFLLASFFTLNCQIAVHQEPFHKLVFEFPEVMRVLDIRAMPSDTTAFHVHNNDLCYIVLDSANVFLESKNDAPKTVFLPEGYANDNITYSKEPFVHRFANVGNTFFRTIGVENLLPRAEKNSKSSFNASFNYTFQKKDERFLMTKLTLEPNEKLTIPDEHYGLIVATSSGYIQIKSSNETLHALMDKGNWFPIVKGEELTIINSLRRTQEVWLVILNP